MKLLMRSKSKLIKFLFILCVVLFLTMIILVSILSYNQIKPYKEIIIKNSNENQISPSLVFAIIRVESGYKEDAVSNRGAIGLMQLTKPTFDYIANIKAVENADIFDPNDNIFLGVAYLRYLFERFETTTEVLASYNAGEGNVSSWLRNPNFSLDSKTLIKIPFPETREYIKKVMFFKKLYKRFD